MGSDKSEPRDGSVHGAQSNYNRIHCTQPCSLIRQGPSVPSYYFIFLICLYNAMVPTLSSQYNGVYRVLINQYGLHFVFIIQYGPGFVLIIQYGLHFVLINQYGLHFVLINQYSVQLVLIIQYSLHFVLKSI